MGPPKTSWLCRCKSQVMDILDNRPPPFGCLLVVLDISVTRGGGSPRPWLDATRHVWPRAKVNVSWHRRVLVGFKLSDLTRPHPKSRRKNGNPLVPGKSRLVKNNCHHEWGELTPCSSQDLPFLKNLFSPHLPLQEDTLQSFPAFQLLVLLRFPGARWQSPCWVSSRRSAGDHLGILSTLVVCV